VTETAWHARYNEGRRIPRLHYHTCVAPTVMTLAILAIVIFELAVTFYAVIRAALKRLEGSWQG